MTEEWTKVETDIWNPEVGEEISGIYLGVETEVGENKSNLYNIEVVEDDKTKQLGIWGCRVLEGKMLAVKVGQQVKIKFNGMVKPEKGREYKSFEVFTKPLEE